MAEISKACVSFLPTGMAGLAHLGSAALQGPSGTQVPLLRLSSPAGVKLTYCSIDVPRCGGGGGTGKHVLSQQLLVF